MDSTIIHNSHEVALTMRSLACSLAWHVVYVTWQFSVLLLQQHCMGKKEACFLMDEQWRSQKYLSAEATDGVQMPRKFYLLIFIIDIVLCVAACKNGGSIHCRWFHSHNRLISRLVGCPFDYSKYCTKCSCNRCGNNSDHMFWLVLLCGPDLATISPAS